MMYVLLFCFNYKKMKTGINLLLRTQCFKNMRPIRRIAGLNGLELAGIVFVGVVSGVYIWKPVFTKNLVTDIPQGAIQEESSKRD